MSTKPILRRHWHRIKIRKISGTLKKYRATCTNHSLDNWVRHAWSLKKIQKKVDEHLRERHEVPFLDETDTWYRSEGQFFRSFDPQKKKR